MLPLNTPFNNTQNRIKSLFAADNITLKQILLVINSLASHPIRGQYSGHVSSLDQSENLLAIGTGLALPGPLTTSYCV